MAVSVQPSRAWRSRLRTSTVDQALAGYLFILPALVELFVFLLGPIVYAFVVSFKHFSYLDPLDAHFIGVQNYIHLFQDPVFLRALWNTTLYALVVVPVQTALAMLLAVVVNRIRGKTVFRIIYYLPSITSTVGVAVIFGFLFQPNGLLNRLLFLTLHIQGPDYFNSPMFALPAIMVVAIWTTAGQFMIIYLAALQDIPTELYEAAAIDGAKGWQILRSVTVPMLKRTTFLVVVLGMIGAFQVFDLVYVISGNSSLPQQDTMTVVLDLFEKGFRTMQMGYASAMGFVLFAIILVLTLIQQLFLGREDS
ncbi:sugar ABC transporter permease [Alicyclobacillus hesperidum]|uniref:Carbohydrate ABC transporter membrane protein 1, CUT1 family n=1 Tax=Alicyclobacillus hesperidum TaxID=89784 RepID=A0A1H2RV39_9BACL|nr:sugar ABC transporter permease [Alicyclobacillus hesperidum]GLV13450.1 sugar ABC transporter permease [Alicyclobacillus hesperidum]SDW23311.1 carbohydrate ABC transporter membrane protein 1, CUT1 family [Alicyclobacillus hesperidum]